MKRSSKSTLDRTLAILWSAWSELGVAGWRGHAFPLAIDPEALLLWTGCLGDADARLRDEALDWAVRYSTLISRSRLQRMLLLWPANDEWSRFAGMLSGATGHHWPGAGKSQRFSPSRKSEIRTEGRPALVTVRLRALCGTTARAELLRILLLAPAARRWSAAELALEACYTKANVVEALESLRIGGVVEATREGNALRYRLQGRAEVESLVDPLPTRRASFLWPTLIAWRITAQQELLSSAGKAVRQVETSKLLAELASISSRAGVSTTTGDLSEGEVRLEQLLSSVLVMLE